MDTVDYKDWLRIGSEKHAKNDVGSCGDYKGASISNEKNIQK